jgi:hypothetical protein
LGFEKDGFCIELGAVPSTSSKAVLKLLFDDGEPNSYVPKQVAYVPSIWLSNFLKKRKVAFDSIALQAQHQPKRRELRPWHITCKG